VTGVSVFPPETLALAEQAIAGCRGRGWRLATAESCTGGLVAAALTAIPASSDVVEGGYLAYSNAAKIELLGVPADMIAEHGAVSPEVAAAMAAGAIVRAGADVAVSVTGLAGPGGGTPHKPVGLVYVGIASAGGDLRTESRIFAGDRAAIRHAALMLALELIYAAAA